MYQLKKLISEAHRRSLWQVLGIYVVGSWLAFQAVQTFTEGLGLPDWVPPLGLVLLIIGLPIVVATAFVQEGLGSREEGGERVEEAPESVQESAPPTSAAATPAGAQHRLLTWRNAIVGGVLGFALLGLATAGWMAMRVTGVGPAGTLVAKGILAERAPLLVADFDSEADDAELARAATDGNASRLERWLERADAGERARRELARRNLNPQMLVESLLLDLKGRTTEARR